MSGKLLEMNLKICMSKKYDLHNFGDLHKLVNNRDVDFIRQHKDELKCWSYFSVWFVFHPDELREFKEYIEWNLFFQTPDMIKQYKKDQLEEFKILVDDEVVEAIEEETHECFR